MENKSQLCGHVSVTRYIGEVGSITSRNVHFLVNFWATRLQIIVSLTNKSQHVRNTNTVSGAASSSQTLAFQSIHQHSNTCERSLNWPLLTPKGNHSSESILSPFLTQLFYSRQRKNVYSCTFTSALHASTSHWDAHICPPDLHFVFDPTQSLYCGSSELFMVEIQQLFPLICCAVAQGITRVSVLAPLPRHCVSPPVDEAFVSSPTHDCRACIRFFVALRGVISKWAKTGGVLQFGAFVSRTQLISPRAEVLQQGLDFQWYATYRIATVLFNEGQRGEEDALRRICLVNWRRCCCVVHSSSILWLAEFSVGHCKVWECVLLLKISGERIRMLKFTTRCWLPMVLGSMRRKDSKSLRHCRGI